jgi:hypothetical protein
MPERDERIAIIAMVRKYGAGRQVEMLCKLWLGNEPSSPPGDVLIALVDALRHTGKVREALAGTDILLAPKTGITRSEAGSCFASVPPCGWTCTSMRAIRSCCPARGKARPEAGPSLRRSHAAAFTGGWKSWKANCGRAY